MSQILMKLGARLFTAVIVCGSLFGPAVAQMTVQTWDFVKLAEPVPGPRAEVTVKGFVQKVHQLNDSIIGDETARTRERDAQRRSAGSPPPSPSTGVAPAKADSGKSAARWVCQLRCTDNGILNEKKGDWIRFEVSAGSQSEAQDRGLESARRHCTVVRKEWGGPQCSKL